MKRDRDTQRARFGKAIQAVAPFTTRLDTMTAVNQYLTKLDRATLVRRYGDAVVMKTWPVDVRDGRGVGRGLSSPEENYVSFPVHSRDTLSVLVTIAHVVLYRQSGNGGRRHHYRDGSRRTELFQVGAWHGWRYCAVVMDLVRFMLGEEAGAALKVSFAAHNVRWTEPVKRVLSKDEKADAVSKGQRLAALMKGRRSRAKFLAQYPEADVIDPDTFGGDWEDLYLMWR